MEFSTLFTVVVLNALMAWWTFGKERERAMLFPDYYFLAEKRLVNHTIETREVKNLDDCELLCYLNDNCVSLNFKIDPGSNSENNKSGHICELNNATHLKYDSDLTINVLFYYRGSKNACDKYSQCKNHATCHSGFTLKGYRCLCPSGFQGEHCENDFDECKTTSIECHTNAACINTHGSYVCTCKPGYTADGLNCTVDPCYNYKNLSDTERKSSYQTPLNGPVFCDENLLEGWYRFVGAAGTKMPTTSVPEYRCGADRSGWLESAHPTVEDGEVKRKVCFTHRNTECKSSIKISVKNCGPYYIYELLHPPVCNSRYCGTD